MAQDRRISRHTHLVGILKIVLPLMALAILASLFLFSRVIDPEDAIPYASVDVADRVREPRMTDAAYSGMTTDGTSLRFSAAEAKPGATANLISVTGTLITSEGSRTELAAENIQIDNAAGLAHLAKGVEITTSTGYVIQTNDLTVALNQTSAISDGPVTAEGPLGQLEAGGMQLTKAIAPDAPYLLVFNKQVRLLYKPAN